MHLSLFTIKMRIMKYSIIIEYLESSIFSSFKIFMSDIIAAFIKYSIKQLIVVIFTPRFINLCLPLRLHCCICVAFVDVFFYFNYFLAASWKLNHAADSIWKILKFIMKFFTDQIHVSYIYMHFYSYLWNHVVGINPEFIFLL